jgi:glutaredoxin
MKQTYYHVICRHDCCFCDKTVKLLEDSKLHFHAEYYRQDEVQKLDEQKKRYDWWTVPIINKVEVKEDGTVLTEFIGGYTDLKELLNVGYTTQTPNEEAETEADDT